MSARRLRAFDWNSRWFWIIVLWEGRCLHVRAYGPQRWSRWLHVLNWEPVPDRSGAVVRLPEAEKPA